MMRISLIAVAVVLGGSLATAGTFEVDKSRSFVGVEVSATPPHQFTVTLADYDATIRFADGKPQSARFAFQFADLDSGKPSRDKKMRGWMDVEKYPEAQFELERVEPGDDGNMIGYGELSMHGQSRPVEVVFKTERRDGEMKLVGEARLDYHDWGLETITMLFFKVKPELHARFHLVGRLSE